MHVADSAPPYIRAHLEEHGADLAWELDEREAIVSDGVGPRRWRVAYVMVCKAHGIEPRSGQQEQLTLGACLGQP